MNKTDGKVQILVVDDESMNLQIIGKQLRDQDYELTLAEDGSVAWEMLMAQPDRFHTVLLDRMMPRMDGMEVLANITDDPDLRDIPVILQTARATRGDIQEGIDAGAYYYLSKPFTKDSLVSIVRTAVRDRLQSLSLKAELAHYDCSMDLLDTARFSLQSLEEGRSLALTLAKACSAPTRVVTGLLELITKMSLKAPESTSA